MPEAECRMLGKSHAKGAWLKEALGMKSGWLVLMAVISPAWAQDMPVYYDYFENGKLTGGRILIDPGDPVHRSAFGLDGAVSRGTWAVTTIVDNGPPTNRIDIVILGDGYTEPELGLYANHNALSQAQGNYHGEK